MRVYTVHMPPLSGRNRDPILVKEGFSWPALLFGPLWTLAHRLWLETVGLIFVSIVLAGAMDAFGLDVVMQAIVSLAAAVLVGAHGPDWRRHGLARRGYREIGVIAARNLDEALARYVGGATGRDPSASVPRVRVTPVPPPPMPIAGL